MIVIFLLIFLSFSGCMEKNQLPLFVTVYYHIEPNPQFFEKIEPGYFEAVSKCLREMSDSLAVINVHATFCFAWLYNDMVYIRNSNAFTGEIENKPIDTGIETFEKIILDKHEIAYHTHPPSAIIENNTVYYARPDQNCEWFDTTDMHRWTKLNADYFVDFFPGLYKFDNKNDSWYGEFIWIRTTESLFKIADYFGITIRHINGGQKPMLDILNKYGFGINHEYCVQQLESFMDLGIDLISPECLQHFHMNYDISEDSWSDSLTGYVSYLGIEKNMQIYYPDINNKHIDREADSSQDLTFMPLQGIGQAPWMSIGVKDDRYYNAALLGGKGGGGVRWEDDVFYIGYNPSLYDPWTDEKVDYMLPSLAEQFNNAINRHLIETPSLVNAWGFDHHVVNIMWTDLTGLSDNWDKEILFLKDIADGFANGVVNEPRPDLVQFVTMQELSNIFDSNSKLRNLYS